jgi:Fic family protein
MQEPKFIHHDLKLIEPSFDSELTDLVIELDHLRRKELGGSTDPNIFFQLKNIFHRLESIGSARIEGNNTTIVEYMETKIKQEEEISEDIKEIQNIEKCMVFIEENVKNNDLNKMFISEIHKIIVKDLSPIKEGDHNPGQYRTKDVKIMNSPHLPPYYLQISEYMDELFKFINKKDNPKYDLLKVALAHHRFVWIHPFTNGNGRTVRLFTYALLVKLGFNVEKGQILNPTAIFCSDRDEYYNKLQCGDKGTDTGLLEWCLYVLKGLKAEIEKIDRLTDYKVLSKEILYPAIQYSLEQEHIKFTESKILKKAVEKQIIQASDLKSIFPGKIGSEISRQIRKLIDKKMLRPLKPNGKKYIMVFGNNYLLRGIIRSLDKEGFLPLKEV